MRWFARIGTENVGFLREQAADQGASGTKTGPSEIRGLEPAHSLIGFPAFGEIALEREGLAGRPSASLSSIAWTAYSGFDGSRRMAA